MARILIVFVVTAMIGYAQGSKMSVDKKTGIVRGVRYDPLGGRIFTSSTTVKASPRDAFKKLMDCKTLCAVLDAKMQKCPAAIGKVGAAATMEIMGDKGTLLTTRVVPDKEIRLTWDPDNGTYICQVRFELASSGTGTKISFSDRFTESSPMSKDDLSKYAGDLLSMIARVADACGGDQ